MQQFVLPRGSDWRPGKTGGYAAFASHVSCIAGYQCDSVERQSSFKTRVRTCSESIQTTHGYIEADLAIKEQALQKLAPAGKTVTRFKAGDALLTFLASL